MQYREDKRSGKPLSILGFGCMRFSRNLTTQIDLKKAERLILEAIEKGVNYFDTAYIYFGSEEALGSILHKNGLREKVYIATKLPVARCHTYEDFDKLLAEQLSHLKTDYIDYYLMHNLSDIRAWERLCALGIETWISEKKSAGRIGQIGFSFHGAQADFLSLMDAYAWDFVQIQYNYMNINYQAGRAGLEKAAEKGLPVIVMEPLLGGKLANGLPPKAIEVFRAINPSYSPAGWALRWLWNHSAVTVVLSGMNSAAQLEENLTLAENASPDMLTEQELSVFHVVEDIFNAAYKIPCTGCNYCMPCPHGVNIPECFASYNASFVLGKITGYQLYLTSTAAFTAEKDFSPGNCVRCGKCENQCPQHIPIMASLEDVKKRMEPFWFRGAKRIVSGWRRRRAPR